jgi:acetyl esterase/lipase
MKKKIRLYLYILLLMLPLLSYSQDKIIGINNLDSAYHSDDVTVNDFSEELVLLDVPYGNHPKQKYDIYLPKSRSSKFTKVLILVHGGGWVAGDKSSMTEYITYLQETNPDHAIVNMNYIRAKEGFHYAFPNQFYDIKNVINTVKEKRNEYGILPSFGLIGRSSGAHISLMYDYIYDKTDDVKFVCSISGPTNFNHPYYTERADFIYFLNILVDQNIYPNIINNLEIISPAHQITKSSSPTILFYGNNDPLVPITNALFLENELIHNNIPNKLTIFDGGHGNWTNANMINLKKKLSDFIDLHLPIMKLHSVSRI